MQSTGRVRGKSLVRGNKVGKLRADINLVEADMAYPSSEQTGDSILSVSLVYPLNRRLRQRAIRRWRGCDMTTQ